MARSVTVATLLADLADMCDEAAFDATSYITQTRAIRYLSQSVHAFSLQHRGFGILSKTTTFATASGTRSYALPTDFAALRYLTYDYQGENRPVYLKPLEEIDLAPLQSGAGWSGAQAFYCIEGEFFIVNDPKAVYTVTVRYVPELPMLDTTDVPIADFSLTTDKLLCKVALEQWIAYDAAIKVLRKQEKDPSLFIAARTDIEASLKDSITERDAMHNQAVTNSWDRPRASSWRNTW